MNALAIRAENLGKSYRIGTAKKRYGTLRDTLADGAAAGVRAARAIAQGSSPWSGRKSRDQFWALRDVSFEVEPGEVVGVIGRNGAGKSTLLKVLCRITEPSEGHADVWGRVGSLLEVGTGFHRELTGRENILLNGAILGMTRREIFRKFDEMVAFAEVEKFIDTPVKQYSSGMYLRLAFSVAAHLEPDILLVDEVLAVGDAEFQAKCLGKMEDVAKAGRTVLFVSHNMAAVRALCGKGIVLDRGRVAAAGDIGESVEAYYRLIGAMTDHSGDAHEEHDGRSVFGRVYLPQGRGNTVAGGDELRVATRLNVPTEMPGFTLVCTIADMNRRSICRLRQDSPALGLGMVQPGPHDVEVALPPLWFSPGLYSVSFEVEFWSEFAFGGKPVSDSFPLDVTGPGTARDVVLSPRAAWSIEAKTSMRV